MRKVFQIVTLGMLGLVLMGSSVSICTNLESAGELNSVAAEYSVPQWSEDGSRIIFSHPPSGVFVVQTDGSQMWSLPPNMPMGASDLPRQLFACFVSRWVSGGVRHGRQARRHIKNSHLRVGRLASAQADWQQCPWTHTRRGLLMEPRSPSIRIGRGGGLTLTTYT